MAADVGESLARFQCNICFELPQEPMVTLCGHLFCWPCLSKWLRIHSRSPECPVCKAVVQEDKLVPLYGTGKDSVDPRSRNNNATHRRTAMAPQADPNRQSQTRMKRKRQRQRMEGGSTSTRNTTSDDPPQLEVRNKKSLGACRSIYVVMNIWDTRPVHSIYKLDYPFDHSTSPQPLQQLTTLEIEGGRTFVSVQTRRHKWIMGFGARHSIIFDAETEEVVHGPNLLNAKDRPALVAMGDKVYTLSSFPKVNRKQDLEPWFEVLDLSRARAVDGRLQDCSWEELPSTPCFPCQLAAHEFFRPPVVFVHSCVLVGSYILILVSFSINQRATYAFDTVSAKWHKVQASSNTLLPFVTCPIPQHGGLYLGESLQGKDRFRPSRAREGHPAVISAYSIKLTSPCDKDDEFKLSVTEFPIEESSSKPCNVVTAVHYSSLDKGVFCSLDWKSRKRVWRSWDDDILANEVHFSKKATITLKTYRMEDSPLLQEEDTLPTVKKEIAVSELPEKAFKVRTKSGGFASPAFLTVFNT